MKAFRLSITVGFLLLSLLFTTVYSDDPPPTPVSGQIAFVSYQDGNSDIYVMNADGTNQRRLTEDKNRQFNPSWSPDGTQIAYFTYLQDVYNLYVMNADGTQQRRLADDVMDAEEGPAWSPDGLQIAYIR